MLDVADYAHDCDPLNRGIADPANTLAQRIFVVLEKTINYSLPENADCGGLVGLVLGEEASFFHVPPANIGKFSGNTSILRAPVQVSINNLDVTVAVRNHALDAGDLPLNGSSIFENQCPAAPGTHAYTIG